MFGKSWKIGSIGGIPIRVDSSWIIVFALVTYSLWISTTLRDPFLPHSQAGALGILGSLLFFGTILLHELAHAVVARARGLAVSSITLVFFGGFTDTNTEEKGPGTEFLVAAVGPLSTLTIGGTFLAISTIIGGGRSPLASMFHYLGLWNLAVGAFNLVPGFPLDGGRMLRAGVWGATGSLRRATRAAAHVGVPIGVAFVVAGVLEVGRGELGLGIPVAWAGSFLISTGRAVGRRETIKASLAGGTVADAMRPPPPAIPAEMTLSEALDRYLRGHEAETFPVLETPALLGFPPRVVGVLTFESAGVVGRVDPLRPVRDALIPMTQVLTMAPDLALDRAVDQLGGGRAALVLRDGELVGIIAASDIARWASAPRVGS